MGFREPSKDDDFGAADEGRLLYLYMLGTDGPVTPAAQMGAWDRRADNDVWVRMCGGTEAIRQEILMISRLRAS